MKTPSALIISRQNLPLQENSSNYEGVKKGGYIISDAKKEQPDVVIVATGSEVALAMDTKKLLEDDGYDVRVVSVPCFRLFDQQSEEYQNSVLGKDYTKRVSLEMSSTFGWGKYAKYNYGLDTFGASANAGDLFKHFKFTKEDVALSIKNYLK